MHGRLTLLTEGKAGEAAQSPVEGEWGGGQYMWRQEEGELEESKGPRGYSRKSCGPHI